MFTDQLGRAVRRDEGTRIGKVDDLVVDLGKTEPHVVALRVRSGRRYRRVPWSAVASFAEDVVITEDPIEDELAADELLLARDVLDTQIFDLGGRRLTRVADIELAWRDREVRVWEWTSVRPRCCAVSVSVSSRGGRRSRSSHGTSSTSPPCEAMRFSSRYRRRASTR